ncbi:MAG TPA: hypothetical protein VEC94_05005 [Pseudolabrys sp.]|nr:hypothetical protein [Pseudolabrys sp.]
MEDISLAVIDDELSGLPVGKASLPRASKSVANVPSCGTEKSPDLLSDAACAPGPLFPFGSGADADWLERISVKAAAQQTATKKIIRPIRTKADMTERPCSRHVGRIFPIPCPAIYRAFCTQTFAVEFKIRV